MNLRLLLLLLLSFVPLAHAADPVAGVDYVEIPGGQPFAPSPGKVEVVEMFGYSCIHCSRLEPALLAWKQRQPAHVQFTPVPAAFGSYWDVYARAFAAASELRLLPRSHQALFDAIHVQGGLPVQAVTIGEVAAFHARFGADPAEFERLMRGPGADALLQRSRRFGMASGVEGTPALIVAGKYRVSGRNFADALRITDYLVAREHAAAQ